MIKTSALKFQKKALLIDTTNIYRVKTNTFGEKFLMQKVLFFDK